MSKSTPEQPHDVTDDKPWEQQPKLTVEQVLEALKRDDVREAIEFQDYIEWSFAENERRVERRARAERGLAVLRALDPAILEELRDTGFLKEEVIKELDRRQAEAEVPW